jgi:RNA polymerase sigma-70 factor (ECF subfamily)
MSALIQQSAAQLTTVTGLYFRHHGYVRRVLRAYGVGANRVDDAVQDVFLIVFRRLDEFVPRASHRTWLFAIAARVARDHRRRVKRKGGLLELEERSIPSSHSDPFAATAAAQSLRDLERRLGELDDAQRRVFVLAEMEQMTAPEIAAELSLKLNTVYSRLRAARRKFGLLTQDGREHAPKRPTEATVHR